MDQATQSRLAQTLLKSLISLREQKGSILIEDLEAILNELSEAIQSADDEVNNFMREEFRKMASHIGATKREICELSNQQEPFNEDLSNAGEQLDAVLKMTEEASNKIMDAADKIQEAVDEGGEHMNETINDAVAQIYMSCNFQDITGQRISKVIRALEYVDEKITAIMQRFGEHATAETPAGEEGNSASDIVNSHETDRKEQEKLGLLDGPALPKDTVSQEDIDALFN
jgi:chemotaxis protein CheZ